jgi:dipeptidyl aminopeptidase/acylaminoacyl peptidase
MTEKMISPYGSWKSPITSDLIVSGSIGLGAVVIDGDDTYWLEVRPMEGGRSVIVKRSSDGKVSDITPTPFNARTRVHEYGGGEYMVIDGRIYFSNFSDQQLYSQTEGTAPQPVTSNPKSCYADGIYDQQQNRLIIVREDHTSSDQEAINSIVAIDLNSSKDNEEILISGSDFYSTPRLSPDNSQLAWLSWNHPNMPWDGTELWLATVKEDGSLGESRLIAGGLDESIFQPQWSPDGTLYFVSDRSGWWNLYRFNGKEVESVYEMAAEFGQPQWVFGLSTYAFASSERIVCSYIERGISKLATINLSTGKLDRIDIPYTDINYLKASSDRVLFRGASPSEPASIVQLDISTGQYEVLRRSNNLSIDTGYLSTPKPIEFPTENGLTAHAFFYAPQNKDYTGAEGSKPQLIVKSHGGPTSATTTALRLEIQYWTSRGFAVLDVNYGGSSGYGRAYRQRLNGQWGIVDVDDCINGARYLVRKGEVDPNRLSIVGGSAGGYTTLCALTFRDLFKAGASYYGVSDLKALVEDTHKFESRYLDRLIGPYPERMDLYNERAPINFTNQLSCPVIFFQGLEDKVVPPNQAEMMFEALRLKGLPVAYVPFEGEQHGFRRAENIKRTLDGELYFYSRIFGFDLADKIEPVKIYNLDQ